MKKKNISSSIRRCIFNLLALAIILFSTPLNSLAVQVEEGSEVGVFSGQGEDYKGKIKVDVTIAKENGKSVIQDIKVDKGSETDSYWQKIIDNNLIEKIISNNGTDGIDTVSGATRSSEGLISAVGNSIKKANGNYKEPESHILEVDITTIFDGGRGTKEEPYQINNKETFMKFASSVDTVNSEGQDNDYKGLHIELNTDLDLSSEENWDPIGSINYAFCGEFDGNGHKITGLKIGSSSNPESRNGSDGLFALLGKGAYVHDLNIDVNIYAISDGSYFIGGLSGRADGARIDDVDVSGNIQGETTSNRNNIFVGGIVGSGLRQEIYNSSADVNLKAVGRGGIAESGGIVALSNRGLIANSYSTGQITGATDRDLEGMTVFGGIAGVNAGTIINCYTNMDLISDTYTRYVGALSGWVTGIGDIFQSYYDPESILIIDNATGDKHVISPSIPIGWAVGPGVTEDNIPYTGSVTIEVEAASPEKAVEKLNSNFSKSYVEFNQGGRQNGHWKPNGEVKLNKWVYSPEKNSKVSFSSEKIIPKYDPTTPKKIDKLLPDLTENLNTGTFYGRSKDKSLLLKSAVNKDSNLESIEVIKGGADQNTLNKIISGGLSFQNLNEGPLKEALDDLINRSKNSDFTSFGIANIDITFESGTGSENDPYIISNEKQLKNFAASINADESFEGKHIKLVNNIVLTEEWMPAGSGGKWPFKGTFDGDNHVISNMVIGSEDNPYKGKYAGLFTNVDNGSVKNIDLKNYNINIEATLDSRAFVGPIVTHVNNGAIIDNIYANGKINIKTNSGLTYVGGLTAQTDRSIVKDSDSHSEINVKSASRNIYGGGIVGLNNRSLITNSKAEGYINAETSLNNANIGGLAGMNAGILANNYADVDLSSVNPTGDIGYLAGRNTGIGYIYDGFYNPNASLSVGGVSLEEKKPVGTIVKNSPVEAKAINSLDDLKPILNSNIKNKDNDIVLSKANEWIENFNIENLNLQEWIIDNGELVHNNKFNQDKKIDSKEDIPKEEDIVDEKPEDLDPVGEKPRDLDKKYNEFILFASEADKDRGRDNKVNKDSKTENTKDVLKEETNKKETQDKTNLFTDIEGHWAYDDILYAYHKGYFKGITETEFGPNINMSRGMFVTVLGRMSGVNDENENSDSIFDDVSPTDYYAPHIKWAEENNIVKGKGDNKFYPNEDITREEMATVIDRYLKYKGIDGIEKNENSLSDMNLVSDWA